MIDVNLEDGLCFDMLILGAGHLVEDLLHADGERALARQADRMVVQGVGILYLGDGAAERIADEVKQIRCGFVRFFELFLILFIILPILLIFAYAFTNADGIFTFQNFIDVFSPESSGTTFKVIGQSLGVAALTTVICILIAYPIAYILANSKFNKNVVLVYLFLLPMWINFVIRTLATRQLLIFFKLETAMHPWVCSIIGMVYNYLPFAILPLYNTMLKLDKNQIEAAADLGASPVQVFIKTIVPMTIPGIVSAATMTFMPTMSSYVITDYLSEHTIQLIGGQIETQFKLTQYNAGSVYAIIMLALIGVSVVFENIFSEKKKGAR